MQFFKFKDKPIIHKILLPLLIVVILSAGTLYYFSLKAISDFAEELIKKDISIYAQEIFSICDKNLTELLYGGVSNDEKSLIIKKGLTLDSIEAYAGQKDISIFIYSEGREILSNHSIGNAKIDISSIKEGQISRVKFNNESYYTYLFTFEPWKWQLLIVSNPAKYSYIENRVRRSYIVSSIVFFLSLFLLFLSLNKSIRRPINSIIESLNNNTLPNYKGTKEIEFLSSTIKAIMNSLQRRLLDIENKEKELRITEEFNDIVINSLNDALYIIEADSFKITRANRIFTDKLKSDLDKIIGKTCYAAIFKSISPCEQCRAQDVVKQGRSLTYEQIFYRKDGSAKYLEVSISPIKNGAGKITHLVFVSRDITERRHLEDQLRQSQKLESIGILSGGIAHDFNNILTAIIGYGNLLQMKLDKDPTSNRYVQQILESSERAVNLVRSLLAFSRKQIVNPIQLDLNEVILKIGKILRRLLEENIELEINLMHDKLIVMVDATQIEQILMNLATNARDAMPKGGTLLIETDCFEIQEDFIELHGYGVPGHYATVSVSDTGSGIDPIIKQKIFDPFFTTKEVGKGTGLGLSTVYGIVKQHDGFINVESEIGKGTTFRIYLPLIETNGVDAKKVRLTDSTSVLEGSETILIAEDEASVRDSYSQILRKFGYKVFEAVDGQEALEVFTEHKDEVDIILSDIIMPRKNGKELIQDIQKIKPDIKVIFMSGYSQDLIDDKSLLEGKTYFMSKPVSAENLLRMIRYILDKPD